VVGCSGRGRVVVLVRAAVALCVVWFVCCLILCVVVVCGVLWVCSLVFSFLVASLRGSGWRSVASHVEGFGAGMLNNLCRI
jgi:hypothetical protein